MSINNCILKTLNMEDQNIVFDEIFVEERKINKKRSLVYLGYLSNNFEFCPKCGCANNNIIIKNGNKKSLIKIPKVSELNCYLELKKQKYKCKNCNKIFVATTSVVDYRCHISNNTKYAVINYSKKAISHTNIASFTNISNVSVQRIIDSIYDNEKLYKHYLPKVLCIDEFTALKRQMAFNICNGENGKTIDLVLGRKVEDLIKYFNYYLKEVREKVKYVVMDMYKPYLELIKRVFKNAKIIIDKFHIVQLISKSLNKTRIKIMKMKKENYRKFKRYWRLILKPRIELESSYWKKYICFKNLMTEVDVVEYLLSQSVELRATYDLYQSILYSLQRNNYELFEIVINMEYKNISEYMKTTLNTLKEFKEHIKNTLEQPYSNGIIERNNNTCKLIKRVAFGFRNFKNFKARIMLATNIFRNKKSNENISSLLNV